MGDAPTAAVAFLESELKMLPWISGGSCPRARSPNRVVVAATMTGLWCFADDRLSIAPDASVGINAEARPGNTDACR
jgi:hypothetical protein